jgi:hypothetical protein
MELGNMKVNGHSMKVNGHSRTAFAAPARQSKSRWS